MLLPHFIALGAGPIVLMLHGAGGNFRSFAPQVERLALSEGVMLARHCMAQASPVTYRHALQAQATFDRDAALSHIHVPTLLIRGEHDPLASVAAMERMAQRIHGSRWVQMPGVGHWPQLESPEAFEALLLDFLDEPPVHWTH